MSKSSEPQWQTPLHAPAPVYLENISDEIDLIELVKSLWQRKTLIAGITAVCTCLGAAFVFMTPPVYEARGYLRPAREAHFSAVNESKILSISPQDQFVASGLLLQSQGFRWQLFNSELVQAGYSDEEKPIAAESSFKRFDSQLSISLPDQKRSSQSDSISVSFQDTDPVYAVNVVNTMIRLALQTLQSNLQDDFNSKVEQHLNVLQAGIQEKEQLAIEIRQAQIVRLEETNALAVQIKSDQLERARLLARQQRLDRMEELQEALKIAQALEIIKPSTLSQLAETSRSSLGAMAVKTEITNQQGPLYMRGQELLAAELAVLKERENDDFTAPEIRQLESEVELLLKAREIESLRLRDSDEAFVMEQTAPLREELMRLQALNIDFSMIEPARIDRMASEPDSPVKPKKSLIMALSLVAGGMLGVFVALIVIALERSRQRQEADTV